MDVVQAYQDLVAQQAIQSDPFQLQALEVLQSVTQEAINPPGFWGKITGKKPTHLGVYLWGGVGRGKTWVMDLYFQHLPIPQKRRVHFHAFMQEIQDKLAVLRGQPDPMEQIVKELATEVRVLCLDEFIVDDIADAMILSGFLHALFKVGIMLVTTSNIIPDKLYQYGLQRERFLPAIAAINQHMEVFYLDNAEDYRTQSIAQHGNALAEHFGRLAGAKLEKTLVVNQREILYLRAAPPALWIKFSEMCDVPLGKQDYLSLVQNYQYLLLEDVFEMTEWQNDQAKRFVTLVDVFYDKNAWVLLPPETSINQLYSGTQLAFEFQRTMSRLQEMKRTIHL